LQRQGIGVKANSLSVRLDEGQILVLFDESIAVLIGKIQVSEAPGEVNVSIGSLDQRPTKRLLLLRRHCRNKEQE